MSKDTVCRNYNAVSRLTRTVMWTAYKATAVFSVWLWQLYRRLTKQLCCSRSDYDSYGWLTKQLCCSRSDYDSYTDGLQSNCAVLGLTVTVIWTAYKATVLFSVWLWQLWMAYKATVLFSVWLWHLYGRLTKQLCCSRSDCDRYIDGLQSNCVVLGLSMTVIIMDGLQSNCAVLGLTVSYMDGLQSNGAFLGLTMTVIIMDGLQTTVLFSVWVWQLYGRLTKQLLCSWSGYDSYNYGWLTEQLCCSRSEYELYGWLTKQLWCSVKKIKQRKY